MSDRQIGQSSIGTGVQITDQGRGPVSDGIPPGYQRGRGEEIPNPEAQQDQLSPEISEQEVRSFILACKAESEDTYKDLRLTWTALWAAANAKQDFTKKKDWQAKVVIPEIPAIIKKATSLICRILLKTDNYFDLDPGLIDDKQLPAQIESPFIAGQKAGIKYHMDIAKMEALFREWFEAAFTYGIGWLKLWWEPSSKTRIAAKQNQVIEQAQDPLTGEPILHRRYDTFFERETTKSSKLAGKVIPPESIYTDADHTFFIEEIMTTLDQVMEWAEGGLLDKGAVERLRAQDYGDTTEETDRLTKLGLKAHQNPFRKKVKLQTFWGTILDRQGKAVVKNAQVILANEMYVLNPSKIENPFWHQKPPFISISPIRCLFRKEGKALAENCLSIAKAINDMTNMTLDGLLWKLLKNFEIDYNRLLYPEQFKGMEPGSPIYTQGGGGNAVREVQVSDAPQGEMATVELFRRSIQNDTGVNDFLLGGQQNKINTTATEASIRDSEGNALFEGISRVIEEGVEEAIVMVQALMTQYWDDFSDPALQAVAQKYGLPFAAPSREMRLQFINPNLRVKVRAISGFFKKAEDLKKYTDFLMVIGKVQPLAMRMNLRELLDRIVRAFMFDDPDKLVVSPEIEAMIQQAEQMKLVMSLMPPGMMPPPAPGTQPPGASAQGPGGPRGIPPRPSGPIPPGPPPMPMPGGMGGPGGIQQ